MSKGNLRTQMPTVAAFIDDLRQTFGTEYIDRIIKAGMRGQPVFYASEGGHVVGTPCIVGARVLRDERGNRCIVVERDGRRHKYDAGAGWQPKQQGE